MVTLLSLTQDIETGENLAWVAEKSIGNVERVYPKEVTDIHSEGDTIQVIAKGVRGGDYYYIVGSDNENKAFFGHPSDEYKECRGSVVFAQRTCSNELVRVKRGIYDCR